MMLVLDLDQVTQCSRGMVTCDARIWIVPRVQMEYSQASQSRPTYHPHTTSKSVLIVPYSHISYLDLLFHLLIALAYLLSVEGMELAPGVRSKEK